MGSDFIKRKIYMIVALLAFILVGCDEEAANTAVVSNQTSKPAIVVERLDQNVDEVPIIIDSSKEDSPIANDESDVGDEVSDSTEVIENETADETVNDDETTDANQADESEEVDENVPEEEPMQEDGVQASLDNVVPGSATNIAFNPAWTYGDFSMIHTGNSVLYTAPNNRNGIVIGINAGHGTSGGGSVKTYSHPDMTPKVTGGTTAAGAVMSTAVSGGMTMLDGVSEASVNLRMAQIVRDKLLAKGYDVLMVRDGSDVQLDNVARTVMCNNNANCHIAIHYDGDNLSYDKGCFYISTPDAIKYMEPVASTWARSDALGKSLISGLTSVGAKIYNSGSMAIDLTQTSYSTVPSVDIELGNAASAHDDATLSNLADGLVAGIDSYFR